MFLCITFYFFSDANDAIEYLNLSWNQFRSKATKEIALGLRVTLFSTIQFSSNLMLFKVNSEGKACWLRQQAHNQLVAKLVGSIPIAFLVISVTLDIKVTHCPCKVVVASVAIHKQDSKSVDYGPDWK